MADSSQKPSPSLVNNCILTWHGAALGGPHVTTQPSTNRRGLSAGQRCQALRGHHVPQGKETCAHLVRNQLQVQHRRQLGNAHKCPNLSLTSGVHGGDQTGVPAREGLKASRGMQRG